MLATAIHRAVVRIPLCQLFELFSKFYFSTNDNVLEIRLRLRVTLSLVLGLGLRLRLGLVLSLGLELGLGLEFGLDLGLHFWGAIFHGE